MAMTVHTVTYTYGGGNTPNRQVDFIRDANSLYARITVINTGQLIGNIPANKITVEVESTTSKMQRMTARLNNQRFIQPQPDIVLSSLQAMQQNAVVQSININPQTTGGRKLEIACGFSDHGNETVTKFKIIDPR